MRISDLRDYISAIEGGKENLKISQISEVLRCLNTISGGAFYKWVRKYL